jgi:hypothetical protein
MWLCEFLRFFRLPLVLAFNRSRVMVLLPQALRQATESHQALTILCLSPQSAVAIGDTENNHELLHLYEAEFGSQRAAKS